MSSITIQAIRERAEVLSANEWKDRIYINVRGNGGNFAGERSIKVYVRADRLNVERGKGLTSGEYEANLKTLTAWLAEQGISR